MGILDFFRRESLFETEDWIRRERELEIYTEHQHKLKPIVDKYYPQLELIQEEWSVMYNSKDYTGLRSRQFEQKCKDNIVLYKQMVKIERDYGSTPPPNAPAFKRLAMLYEKQGLYEQAVLICIDALNSGAYGDGMRSRLARMIKKAGRSPTKEELLLLDS